MSDRSFNLLQPFLNGIENGKTLWVADENLLGANAQNSEQSLNVITNRHDIYQQCLSQELCAEYSDFDFSDIESESIARIVYRISKERAVVHHIANASLRILKPGGELVIAGEKGEGAKGYIDKIGKLFGNKTQAQKHGSVYFANITKANSFDIVRDNSKLLDDKDYTKLREIHAPTGEPDAVSIWSKPGQFGWNKLDQGSTLLMKAAEQFYTHKTYPTSIIDLGCGYGFLTLHTRHWPTQQRVATDNNAAAITSAKHNFVLADMDVDVIADDCARTIQTQFDCVLCNPPFHQGFSSDSDLTDKFLHNARRLLNNNGTALFVVNQFIGLEKRATTLFDRVELLAEDGQFKVFALKP